jgi:hypothetical protein
MIMKVLRLLSLLLLVLAVAACGDDEDQLGAELSYDGPNFTGPILDPGIHILAARFTSNEIANYVGRDLERVSFFLGSVPEKVEVVVFGEGTPTSPGPELYRLDLTQRATPLQFNDHRLQTPITLTEQDIWLAVQVTHSSREQSVGCDAGPRDPNGDWIFSAGTPGWTTFNESTGGSESVNWNIRGYVE